MREWHQGGEAPSRAGAPPIGRHRPQRYRLRFSGAWGGGGRRLRRALSPAAGGRRAPDRPGNACPPRVGDAHLRVRAGAYPYPYPFQPARRLHPHTGASLSAPSRLSLVSPSSIRSAFSAQGAHFPLAGAGSLFSSGESPAVFSAAVSTSAAARAVNDVVSHRRIKHDSQLATQPQALWNNIHARTSTPISQQPSPPRSLPYARVTKHLCWSLMQHPSRAAAAAMRVADQAA